MQAPEVVSDRFRRAGRKVTPQRQCIFRLLQENRSHPSAEALFEQARQEMATISLKTVYQTLHELAGLGEIARLDVGTGTVRFDPNVEHAHHHLVCRACGEVRDIEAGMPEVRLPSRAAQGFEVGPAEVVFRGLCPECRQGGAPAETSWWLDASGGVQPRPAWSQQHGSQQHGSQQHGSQQHGSQQHGSQQHGSQQREKPEHPREEQQWQS